MHRGLILVVLAASTAIVAAPGGLSAQLRPWEISIVGGPSFPSGEFADEANTGYHVQGSVGFPVPALPFGIRADALWQETRAVEEDGWFRQIGGLLNATFGLTTGMIQPYGLVGAGFVRTQPPQHEGHVHESENHLGFNAGAGVDFPFAGLTGVLEVRYLNIAGGGDATAHRTIPVSIGIKF